MTLPDELEPYLVRARALAPVVLSDLWRGTRAPPGASDRLEAFLAATGHLLRYETIDVGADVLAALERCTRTPGIADRARDALRDLSRQAHDLALRTPARPPALTLADRLADVGDAEQVADRLLLLDDADDQVSVLAAACFPQGGVPRASLQPVLPLACSLTRDLDDQTRFRLEAAVERMCNARALWTDPFGWPLWTAVAEPDQRPRVLAWLAEGGAVAWPDMREERLAAAPARRLEEEDSGIILVLATNERGAGKVVRVRVSIESAGVWGDHYELAPVALNAVRAAYRAAARCLASGAPPPLANHRVRLDGAVRIDGDSLGLPLAVAFYSLWTGQQLPRGSAATGRIDPFTGAVREVAQVDAKVEAWVDQHGQTGASVLVPAKQVTGPALGAQDLGGALVALGLERQACQVEGCVDVRGQVTRLRELVSSQGAPDIGSVEGASAWQLAADEMLLLVDALSEEQDHGLDLDEARLSAALAYLHAGEVDLAEAVLKQLERCPPELELLAATVALSKAIDDGADTEPLEERVAALLDSREVRGERYRAVGTRGRARMHGHRPGAVELLEQAVDLAPDRERARSRIYLSMALREAGRLDQARAQCESAEADLTDMRRWDQLYAADTLGYLRYEQARVALALGDLDEAKTRIDEALASRPASAGWWPRLAMARVAAQVSRARGEDAARWVAEAEALATRVRGVHRTLAARLVAEARGELVDPPEVW